MELLPPGRHPNSPHLSGGRAQAAREASSQRGRGGGGGEGRSLYGGGGCGAWPQPGDGHVGVTAPAVMPS